MPTIIKLFLFFLSGVVIFVNAAPDDNTSGNSFDFRLPKDFKIPVEVGFSPHMKLDIEPTMRPSFDFSNINNQATTEQFRGAVSSFINPHNSMQFGGLVALSIAVMATAYFAVKVLWNVINKKLMEPKPTILLPGTKYGYWDRVKRWWHGYKTPEIIVQQEIKERLDEIVEKACYIRDHNKKRKSTKITYDNLFLYGKPGTGKTLFARILADRTNMDFVSVTAASLLQSGVAGVKYCDQLMKMARKSKYGLIIFIDEADALFVDRDSLDPDSDHYKILSHLLALTGEGSSTFMLVVATNYSQVIDSAMARRFQDRVDIPLPDVAVRRELITAYIHTIMCNKKENSKKFIETAQSLLTKKVIDDIAEKTEGFSPAEIKDIIYAMHKKAVATQSGIMTVKHIHSAIEQGIAKHQSFEHDAQHYRKYSTTN